MPLQLSRQAEMPSLWKWWLIGSYHVDIGHKWKDFNYWKFYLHSSNNNCSNGSCTCADLVQYIYYSNTIT